MKKRQMLNHDQPLVHFHAVIYTLVREGAEMSIGEHHRL